MKLISIKKTGHKNYTLDGNHYVVGGLIAFLLLFLLISLLAWSISVGLFWAGVLMVFIMPIVIVQERIGKKRHSTIHKSKLFRGLKETAFRSEIDGAYNGLIRNMDGRTLRIYYDWNKRAQGFLSFGDVVIELFYEPIIESYNDFEPKIKAIKALNKEHRIGYGISDWQYFAVDRMVIALNYYPWTKTKTVLDRVDRALRILEIERLSTFDIENLGNTFKKQLECGVFKPRIDLE